MAHALVRLMPRKGAEAVGAECAEDDAASHVVELPKADMACLRGMQQKHARLFELQKRKVQFLHAIYLRCILHCLLHHCSVFFTGTAN